jgi:hypothetical protein
MTMKMPFIARTHAAIAAVSVAGLLAGVAAPVAAESYTGCLTPGGTITRVAPGVEPAGGGCPGNQEEIILQYGEPMGGISGYEIVEQDFTVPPDSNLGEAVPCTSGKKALSGGVAVQPQNNANDATVVETFPFSGGAFWFTLVRNTSPSVPLAVRGYAVCADVVD